MEGHIYRQNTLMFARVFCFELRARAARTCCHCHLAVKNPIHDVRSVKTAKKVMNGTTVWSCDTDCVQMASKQPNVEFSSHIFQFTRLHCVADMQGLTFQDSVVTLVKSSRWYVLSGTGFLVAHQLYNMKKFATTEFAKKTNTATNVNDMWNHFTDMIKACRDKFIPHKVIKRGGWIKQHMPYE